MDSNLLFSVCCLHCVWKHNSINTYSIKQLRKWAVSVNTDTHTLRAAVRSQCKRRFVLVTEAWRSNRISVDRKKKKKEEKKSHTATICQLQDKHSDKHVSAKCNTSKTKSSLYSDALGGKMWLYKWDYITI